MTRPRHEWPFKVAATVRRTSLVKVLSEDEPANEQAREIVARPLS